MVCGDRGRAETSDLHDRAADSESEGDPSHCARRTKGGGGESMSGRGDWSDGAGVDFATPRQHNALPGQIFSSPTEPRNASEISGRKQMTAVSADTGSGLRPIRNLRWWIGGLLFASTVINYIDRQTLSFLAPYLKQDYHWTNTDYANLVIIFRIAYSLGQTICGRAIDRIGTRRGLTLSVLWYSLVSILTPLARGFFSFAAFRFLLGAGESANWPGATK